MARCWSTTRLGHDLADFLSSTFPHPTGRRLGIDAASIDAGDGASARRVTAFCAGRAGQRWLPIKGASGASRAALVHTATRRAGQHSLHIVGVDMLKGRLFDRIAKRAGIRFSKSLPMQWYDELLCEHRVIKYSRGAPYAIFQRYPGRNAEALDTVIYALAARCAVTVSPERRRTELAGITAPVPAVVRCTWLAQSSRAAVLKALSPMGQLALATNVPAIAGNLTSKRSTFRGDRGRTYRFASRLARDATVRENSACQL